MTAYQSSNSIPIHHPNMRQYYNLLTAWFYNHLFDS